jgi:hypothetical protein
MTFVLIREDRHGFCCSFDHPSFLVSVRCSGLSGAPGRRGSPGRRDQELTVLRITSRFALSLLIAAVHLAGASSAPGGSRSPSGSAYRCCCIGECHCTGDCCNHAPGVSGANKRVAVHLRTATPSVHGSKRCGVWQCTLQRAPEKSKAKLVGSPNEFPVLPDPCRAPSPSVEAVTSSERLFQPSSPRAPPENATQA